VDASYRAPSERSTSRKGLRDRLVSGSTLGSVLLLVKPSGAAALAGRRAVHFSYQQGARRPSCGSISYSPRRKTPAASAPRIATLRSEHLEAVRTGEAPNILPQIYRRC